MMHPLALRQRLTAAVTAGGTLTVTLALLAGMPYVLWRAAGIPWPERVYSWSQFADRLAEPVGDPLLIELLAVVGWVCWAAFACTVVRETFWYTTHLPQLLRDRHTHTEHVATLSVKGSLAALCIGTLVVALIGLWRPQTAGAQQPSFTGELRAQIAATAPRVPAPGWQAALAGAAAAAESPSEASGVSSAQAVPADEVVQHVEYTVVEGDTLWDIAHTHLGDSLKWPRIYKLNKDRVQSDGCRLTDPDRIQPGWQLTLPTTQQTTPSQAPIPAAPGPEPDARPAPPAANVPAVPLPGRLPVPPAADGKPPLRSPPGSAICRSLDS